jgi:tetratricopeptide (TPR) repeat protein
VEQAIEAARLADESGDLESRCISQLGLAHSHAHAGRLTEALDFIERGLGLVGEDRTIGVKTVGFSAFIWLVSVGGIIRGQMGELEASRRDLDRAVELARELNNAENSRASSLSYLGAAQLLHEEWQEAIDALEQGLAIARGQGTRLDIEAVMLANLARAYLGAGQVEKARRTAEEALQTAHQRGELHHEIRAQLSLAHALLADDGANARAAIEETLARAFELVRETGAKAYEPHILEARAELARALGDEATYKRQLREAHRLFVEIGATGHAKRLAKELGL